MYPATHTHTPAQDSAQDAPARGSRAWIGDRLLLAGMVIFLVLGPLHQAAENTGGIIMLVGWLVSGCPLRFHRGRGSLLLWSILAYILYSAIAMLWAWRAPGSSWPRDSWSYVRYWLLYPGMLIAAAAYVTNPRRAVAALALFLAGTLLPCAGGITQEAHGLLVDRMPRAAGAGHQPRLRLPGQKASNMWRLPYGSTGTWGVGSTIGHRNNFGTYVALAIPLAIGFLSQALQRGMPADPSWPPLLRYARRTAICVAVLLTLFLGPCLLFSFSKGAWMASVAGVFVTLCALCRAHWRQALSMLLIAVTATLIVCSVHEAPLRMLQGVSGESLTTVQRKAAWRTALQMWRARPLTGQGPGTFQALVMTPEYDTTFCYGGKTWHLRDPNPLRKTERGLACHNYYLETLAGGGIIGLALLLVVLGSLVTLLVRNRRAWAATHLHGITAGLLGSGVVFLVHSSVCNPWVLRTALFFWFLMGVAASLATHSPQRR